MAIYSHVLEQLVLSVLAQQEVFFLLLPEEVPLLSRTVFLEPGCCFLFLVVSLNGTAIYSAARQKVEKENQEEI
jgi:hypothetical protein